MLSNSDIEALEDILFAEPWEWASHWSCRSQKTATR